MGPLLPVIGLSGILVIVHIPIRIAVPAIPITYQILPQLFIIDKTQKSCAMPATTNFDEDQLEYFFDSMFELKKKLLALLIQLPPSMQIVEGLDALRNIIPYLDKSFRYAVEVRHRSWFQDLAYNFLSNNNMCLVWSQPADLHTPPIVTSDFVYVRFIGDRSIQEKDFGHIQIDRIKEMKKVARNFKAGIDKGNLAPVKFAIVAANNHYAGFGPGTVNIFRQLLDLDEVQWVDEYVMAVDNPTGKENDDTENDNAKADKSL